MRSTCGRTGCGASWPAGGTPAGPQTETLGKGPAWCWLTPAGMRLLGLSYSAREPSVARLAHIRAVLAVRLWLQSGQAYQQGRAWWRSERRIRAAAGGRVGIAHLPDAEIHWPSLDDSPYAGQIWAIEAELTPKPLARTDRDHAGHADPHQRLRAGAVSPASKPATPRSST